jgi:hypothetical protein
MVTFLRVYILVGIFNVDFASNICIPEEYLDPLLKLKRDFCKEKYE